jgi:putative flippase GtrA
MVGQVPTVVRFVLVGMVNTLVGLALIYAAKWFMGAGDVTANAFGYGTGLLVSFTLNRTWTFAHSGPAGRAFVKFLAVQGVAYGMNLVCVMSLIAYGVDSYVAQAFGVPPYTIVSYFGSRYLAFASDTKMAAESPRQ